MKRREGKGRNGRKEKGGKMDREGNEMEWKMKKKKKKKLWYVCSCLKLSSEVLVLECCRRVGTCCSRFYFLSTNAGAQWDVGLICSHLIDFSVTRLETIPIPFIIPMSQSPLVIRA